MLILAIEQSSDRGSIALLEDETILGEKEWNGLAERSGGIFVALKKLLAEFSMQMGDIEAYAVDIGPGSYSGLRASMSAVRAFALPENQPIYALRSADVIALEIMNKYSADKVQVVGDARRRQWWTCVYKLERTIPVVHTELHLTAENDFHPVAEALVVSPDWHRIGEKLKFSVAGNAGLIEEPCVPKAAQLGRLAYRKICLKTPSEPLKIIYLHAAVGEAGSGG